MASSALRHKHVRIDQLKLRKARRLLDARTDTEALDRALALVVAEGEIDSLLRGVAGKGKLKKSSGDMRRLVIDTNIYIDWINRGQHEAVLFQRDAVKYLSAVVMMELRAGAILQRDRRLLKRLQDTFEMAGRILTPSRAVFAEAGDALQRLRTERGYNVGAGHSIANDVLIALSARSIGAEVVTQNERDYRAIQAVRPFRLVIAPQA